MKLKLIGLAALAVMACLVVPVSAQGKAAPRKILIKEKQEVGLVVSEKTTEVNEERVTQSAGGNDSKFLGTERNEQERTTETLSLSEAGEVTDGRVTYLKDRKNKAQQGPEDVELSKEEESTGDLEGVTIRYTFDAKAGAFTAKLEKGESAKDTEDVVKAMRQKKPFTVPFIPNKEVEVGQSWEVDETALREFINPDEEKMKLAVVKATCKLEEITSTKAGEVAKVSFTLNISGTGQHPNLGELEISGKNEGCYYFDLTTCHCTKVEMKAEFGFEKELETPQGKVKVTYKMTGTETKEFSYAKAEKKDGK